MFSVPGTRRGLQRSTTLSPAGSYLVTGNIKHMVSSESNFGPNLFTFTSKLDNVCYTLFLLVQNVLQRFLLVENRSLVIRDIEKLLLVSG